MAFPVYQYKKSPCYEISALKLNIKHDTKLQLSQCWLFSVRQRKAYILLLEPPVLYSVAFSQVLLHLWDTSCHYYWKNLFSQWQGSPTTHWACISQSYNLLRQQRIFLVENKLILTDLYPNISVPIYLNSKEKSIAEMD